MYFYRYPNLSTATESLEQRGFTAHFVFTGDQLRIRESNETFAPEQLTLTEYHRFPETQSGESRMIFAFETENAIKGVLISVYRQRQDMKLISFIDRVPIRLSGQEQ